jgi:hypothetical protein
MAPFINEVGHLLFGAELHHVDLQLFIIGKAPVVVGECFDGPQHFRAGNELIELDARLRILRLFLDFAAFAWAFPSLRFFSVGLLRLTCCGGLGHDPSPATLCSIIGSEWLRGHPVNLSFLATLCRQG